MQHQKAIKINARLALKKNWAECILASLISVAVFICTVLLQDIISDIFKPIMYAGDGMSVTGILITSALFVLFFFITVPVLFGTVRWFWYCSYCEKMPLCEIFYYYSNRTLLAKTVLLGIRFVGELVFTAVICLLPAGILFAVHDKDINVLIGYSEKISDVLFWVALIVFLLISIPLIFKVALRSVLAPVMLIIDEDIDPFYAITLSKKVLRGRRNETFMIFVSFIGWIVLSLFGVTLIYTLPFFNMAYVVFARYSVINHRLEYTNNGVKPLI